MEVPIRLVRCEEPRPADAFLLFAADPAPLAAACERLGELPRAFVVRGGFLLVPREAESQPVSGALRLRRLAGDLFVPSDADLLPALLADEMASLTRSRGLVVLPGAAVLAFDATAPLPVSRWLAPANVRRAEWEPFPPRPDRAAALTVIERPAPPVAAILEVLGEGAPGEARPLAGPGEGTGGAVPEDARPASGSKLGQAAAGAGLAAAGFLAWLGKQLGAEGLARLGGDLARRALDLVPRLSERVLGEQEAALRDVLRELQSGDVEKGLRHAPPAVADPDQPARIGTDAKLAARDPRYSLRDLIGTGGGAGTAWLGGGDVWAQLASEYRRLAVEAAARGDHRRAAYLYGVLLRDLRAAANALLAGGHYRDAALLFRDRLKDPLAAAAAFDQAGDHDEALRLYDRLADFERAGDLLRRLGEEARAAEQYARAATRLFSHKRFLAAGDMMRTKAHRPRDARDCYRLGWARSDAESRTCGERLLDEFAAARDRPAVLEIWTEAERDLKARPHDAGLFFNYALRSADFLPADTRADLADRAKLYFAAHLRTHALVGEAGPLVGVLFPTGGEWAAPVGRDAVFAVRNRRPEPRERPATGLVPIVTGPVTAVAVVPGTFDLLVAAADGVVYWRVSGGPVVPVWTGRERVTALAASARAEVAFALTHDNDEVWLLRAFTASRSGDFSPVTQHSWQLSDDGDSAVYLQPAAVFRNGGHHIKVATRTECFEFTGSYLRAEAIQPLPEPGAPVRLLVDTADGHWWSWLGETVRYRGPDEGTVNQWHVPWVPMDYVDSLTPAPGVLEIAAVDVGGRIHWAKFFSREPQSFERHSALASYPKGYSAVCLVAPGVVVAATNDNEIRWFSVAGGKLIVSVSVEMGLPSRVFALAPRPDANEVVAVLTDGHAIRVHRP